MAAQGREFQFAARESSRWQQLVAAEHRRLLRDCQRMAYSTLSSHTAYGNCRRLSVLNRLRERREVRRQTRGNRLVANRSPFGVAQTQAIGG